MHSGLIANLALALLAAVVGAIIATRLRQSAVIGYIAAGVVIGPFTPGFVADPNAVQELADIGLVFLLFTIGAELSLGDLARAGKVALIGGAVQVLVTIALGTLMGLARLSSNWLVARLATVYVEGFRNIPLALQLLFWWALLREAAPSPRQAWQPLPGVFVSNRGILFPVPLEDPAHLWMLFACALGILATFAVKRWARRRQERTGEQFPIGWVGLGLVLGLPLAVFLAHGAPLALDWPALRGFNFAGGTSFSPEFGALLIGLVAYTGSFTAEIVRAGILAVSWGQSEAAMALGLKPGQRMRLIVLPQALRVIVPPMTSEYLSLTKNSSLAVIIGYPDLVSIANTTINQTGQAVEGIAMIMAVYLVISLVISLLMNLYNRAVALVER